MLTRELFVWLCVTLPAGILCMSAHSTVPIHCVTDFIAFVLFTVCHLIAAGYVVTQCGGKKAKPPTKFQAPPPQRQAKGNSATSTSNKKKAPGDGAKAAPKIGKQEENQKKEVDLTQGTRSSEPVDMDKIDEKQNGEDKDTGNTKLKPKQIQRNEKEQKIAAGEVRKKTDYPTFNDVESDWDSDKEKDKKKAAAEGGADKKDGAAADKKEAEKGKDGKEKTTGTTALKDSINKEKPADTKDKGSKPVPAAAKT